MRSLLSCSLGIVLLAATTAQADVESGPRAGEKVAELKVFAVTGEVENKKLDYAARRKGQPTIYIFIRADQWSRPMARFVRALDASVTKIDKNAALVAVWLSDDHEKTKAYLPRAHDALKLEHTALTYFPGDKTGPGAWGINSEAFLTAVVAHKGKVAATFGYVSVNETVVPDVEKALKQAIGKQP